MYNNDPKTLNAGAYANLPQQDIRLSGDHHPTNTQQNSGIMAAGPGTYTQNRKRQMAAGGGIMGSNNGSMLVAPTADGSRPGYGFLSDLKDKFVDDIIPNEIKENPLLTAAIVGGGLNQFGLPDFLPDVGVFDDDFGQNWLGNLLGNINPNLSDMVIGDTDAEKAAALAQPSGYFGSDTTTGRNKFLEAMGVIPSTPSSGLVNYALQQLQGGSNAGDNKLTGMFSSALSPYLGEGAGRRVNPLYPLGIGAAVGKYVEGLPKDTLPMDTTSIDPAAIATAARGTDAEGAAAGLRFLPDQVTRAAQGGRIGYAMGGGKPHTSKEGIEAVLSRYQQGVAKLKAKYGSNWRNKMEELEDEGINMADVTHGNEYAQGGRIGAQEGGLMNLGGMEKDYRQEGGFVPIGGKEKADDVPARLSKNEFVFTADAVRGAGGGDIDKGAEIMENVMKHLEAGGEVSEESQGLEGARGMFANAQQLEKRII